MERHCLQILGQAVKRFITLARKEFQEFSQLQLSSAIVRIKVKSLGSNQLKESTWVATYFNVAPTTLSIMTLSITTLSTMTLGIKGLRVTVSMNDTS